MIAPQGDRATVVIAATLMIGLAASSLDRGGFTAGGQRVLLLLGGIALIEVIALAPDALVTAARSGAVVSLVLLGVLTILSALWTIGSPDSATRAGLELFAYASMALAGYALAKRTGPRPIEGFILVCAMIEAAIGLTAAALHDGSFAVLVHASWRPAGTYGYPPALALLEVCGLPIAVCAATRPLRKIAFLGVLGLILSGATLGCADNRTALALACLALISLAIRPAQIGLTRSDILAATCLLAAAALTGALLIGRHTTIAHHSGGPMRLSALLLACAILESLWPLIRTVASRLDLRLLAMATVLALGAAATLWLLLGYTSTVTSTGNGLGHGRISYWTAAAKAWQRHPILGSGANTFYAASVKYQAPNDKTIFAHNLPLELAVELGIGGFLLGASLYVTSVRQLWRTAKSPENWLIAPTVALFLLDNLIDWPWHLAGLAGTWAAATGALAGRAQRRTHNATLSTTGSASTTASMEASSTVVGRE